MRPIVVITLIFLMIPLVGFAQDVGKIAGIIKDKNTGEPLVGVNILVKNTFLGASSDASGQFIILNVPAGNYRLEFSYIGYKKVTMENVQVRIDRTTYLDVEMEEAIIEGDVVVVEAERPIVERDKTSSSMHFEAKEINILPAEGIRNVLELSAAINKNADGTISVRGGDALEVNFIVDGIKSLNTNTGIPAYGMGSKSDNNWKFDINPLAVAQMEVITGGFNAEYGNAQSGVIKMTTREGGSDFSGGFIFEYRPPGKYHWGDYLYSKKQPEWQMWGNIDAWYEAYRDSSGHLSPEAKELAEINYRLWIKNHTPSDDNILGVYDYRKYAYTRYLFSFGGPLGKDARRMNFFFSGEIKNRPTRLPTVEKVQKLRNFSLKLTFKPSPAHQFHLTGLYQFMRSGMGSGSDDIRWSGLWSSYGARRKYTLIYDSPREETVFAQTLEYKYIASASSYFDLNLTHQSETLFALQVPTPGTDRDRQLHPDPKDRLLEDTGIWLKGPVKEYRTYFTWSSLYNQASLTDYYELKAHFASQVTKTNLFKAGLEAWLMDQDYNASSSLAVSAYIWRTGFATNYKAKTWYTAAYVQDKLEFAGMVGNIGVRMDMYNFGTDEVPVDETDFFYPGDGLSYPGKPEFKKSNTFVSFSPRVGLSFPIGEKTAFRIQYGHFRSMPTINQALDRQTFNGWALYGNANLKPKLSVNYEFGVQQNLWDTHQLDIVTYYNDLKYQINPVYVKSATGSVSKSGELKGTYLTYRNNGYGNSRGVEITFKNRADQRWRYSVSYSISQSTRGYHGFYLIDPSVKEDLERYLYSTGDFLIPEDRTHRLNASLTYSLNQDEGPQLAGMHIFENMNISVIYRLASGLPYFYSAQYQYNYQVESNRRYPIESTTDLRIEKVFNWNIFNFKLALRILNVFDNKHLTPISDPEELERWVLRSVTYQDLDYTTSGQANLRPTNVYNYFQTFRNIPRQIFFSIGFTF